MAAAQDLWINVQNRDEVQAFVYSYLGAHSRPWSEDDVHNITMAVARYKGPAVIRDTTLHSFLAALLPDRCARLQSATATESPGGVEPNA